MIGKILRDEIAKRIRSGSDNARYVSLRMDKIFKWIMVLWVFPGVALTLSAYEYGWDSTVCTECNQIVRWFPSIDVAANKTEFPNAIRILWIYLFCSTPIAFVATVFGMGIRVRFGIDAPPRPSGRFFVFSFLFFALLILSAGNGALTGEGFGGGSNYYAHLYRTRILYSIFLSYSIFGVIILFLYAELRLIYSYFTDQG